MFNLYCLISHTLLYYIWRNDPKNLLAIHSAKSVPTLTGVTTCQRLVPLIITFFTVVFSIKPASNASFSSVT